MEISKTKYLKALDEVMWYLEKCYPDYERLTEEMALNVLGIRAMHIWYAYKALKEGVK